jgi:hypothetical protein
MSALLVTAAVALELGAAVALTAGVIESALALHFAAAGSLAHAFARDRRLDGRAALGTGWLWAGAFPLLGVIAGAALFAMRGRKASRVAVEESWQERRSQAARRAQAETERAQHVSADVVPLVDALRAGHGGLRISAMEAVKDRHSRPIVLMLARERQNTLYDVRFRAVEHLGRINDRSLGDIAESERALAEGPETAALHEKLAQQLFEHAELGLDAAEITRNHLTRVVVHAERALALGKPSAATVVLLARSFWRLGAPDRAELELRRAQEIEPGNGEALYGLAELQFARKDFHGLKHTCQRLMARGDGLSREKRQAVEKFATWRTRPV